MLRSVAMAGLGLALLAAACAGGANRTARADRGTAAVRGAARPPAVAPGREPRATAAAAPDKRAGAPPAVRAAGFGRQRGQRGRTAGSGGVSVTGGTGGSAAGGTGGTMRRAGVAVRAGARAAAGRGGTGGAAGSGGTAARGQRARHVRLGRVLEDRHVDRIHRQRDRHRERRQRLPDVGGLRRRVQRKGLELPDHAGAEGPGHRSCCSARTDATSPGDGSRSAPATTRWIATR